MYKNNQKEVKKHTKQPKNIVLISVVWYTDRKGKVSENL